MHTVQIYLMLLYYHRGICIVGAIYVMIYKIALLLLLLFFIIFCSEEMHEKALVGMEEVGEHSDNSQ